MLGVMGSNCATFARQPQWLAPPRLVVLASRDWAEAGPRIRSKGKLPTGASPFPLEAAPLQGARDVPSEQPLLGDRGRAAESRRTSDAGERSQNRVPARLHPWLGRSLPDGPARPNQHALHSWLHEPRVFHAEKQACREGSERAKGTNSDLSEGEELE